jgi:transcription attenuation protein (tryptophan RNA-binding attenuator protein)
MNIDADYVMIKALEDGVTIIGLTRGENTTFNHTEKLDKGEVLMAQFTENTSAIKIRGNAEIVSKHGKLNSGE